MAFEECMSSQLISPLAQEKSREVWGKSVTGQILKMYPTPVFCCLAIQSTTKSKHCCKETLQMELKLLIS